MTKIRTYLAELIGTFILVFMGCGSAIVLGCDIPGGHLAVALAFGLSIVAAAYVIGNVSGCHINPAVSLAMLVSKRMSVTDFIGYIIAQVVGAIAAAGLLQALVGMGIADKTGGLGTNGVPAGDNGLAIAFIIEIVLTFIFIFTILGVTADKAKSSIAGVVIGLTLAFVHIVGIPITGTSVNPARSLGPAIFAGGEALSNVWVFIIAPFIGAVLAALAYKLVVKLKEAK